MLTSLYLTKTINRKAQDHFFCSDTPAMILLSKLGITFFPHVVLRRQIYHINIDRIIVLKVIPKFMQ